MQENKRRDTKAALIRAAERLFAEKGLGGVSVRDITTAAGARNQSALHYHFGGMDELVREIFARRYRDIESARLERLEAIEAAGQSLDIQVLMEAGVGPLFEACLEEDGRLYARFSLQLMTDPRYDVATLVSDVGMDSAKAIGRRVAQALEDLPDETVTTRLRHIFMISVMLVADYARLVEAGSAPPVKDATREAATTLCGFLEAGLPPRT